MITTTFLLFPTFPPVKHQRGQRSSDPIYQPRRSVSFLAAAPVSRLRRVRTAPESQRPLAMIEIIVIFLSSIRLTPPPRLYYTTTQTRAGRRRDGGLAVRSGVSSLATFPVDFITTGSLDLRFWLMCLQELVSVWLPRFVCWRRQISRKSKVSSM